jgi:uncharacterized protein (UPF0332 family)
VNEALNGYPIKSRESLVGAESELASGRHNNAANRAYYACFQAAIVALLRAAILRTAWPHEEVQRLFAGELIGRRKLYPSEMRRVLNDLAVIRVRADYEAQVVTRRAATDAVREARRFVDRIIGEVR